MNYTSFNPSAFCCLTEYPDNRYLHSLPVSIPLFFGAQNEEEILQGDNQ